MKYIHEKLFFLSATIEEGSTTRDSDLHKKKVALSITVIEECISICVNDEHSRKAEDPIEVKEEGFSICFSEEQFSKAYDSIDFTGVGIETFVNKFDLFNTPITYRIN